jgi:hypothetical protein
MQYRLVLRTIPGPDSDPDPHMAGSAFLGSEISDPDPDPTIDGSGPVGSGSDPIQII